ncbi:hypothetical protein FXB39_07840 [Nocardioides sp. BGMRC 2183]|nr:hypothetical protein FXB39_07840 [Nocardioides sp. BGMRC 2183]
MPRSTEAVGYADAAADALRDLAAAVSQCDAPEDVYPILGELCRVLASIEQTLHQFGALHDARQGPFPGPAGGQRSRRAASYQVAWELHRAAEMTHQITTVVERAHEVQASITYDVHPVPTAYRSPTPLTRQATDLSL